MLASSANAAENFVEPRTNLPDINVDHFWNTVLYSRSENALAVALVVKGGTGRLRLPVAVCFGAPPVNDRERGAADG